MEIKASELELKIKQSTPKRVRIVFDIDQATHRVIRIRAVMKNISMRKYILQAIIDKIAREESSE